MGVTPNIEQFMDARQKIMALPESVRGFLDTPSRQEEDFGTEKNTFDLGVIVTGANAEKLKSGLYDGAAYSSLAEAGEKSRGGSNDEETKEEKDRKANRFLNTIMEQTMTYEGMKFDYKTVTTNLSSSLDQQRAYLETKPQEVKREDMLYVDNSGKVVKFDHPEARAVETNAEKIALETRDKVNYMGLTVEGVAKTQDGTTTTTEEANARIAIEEGVNQAQTALSEVEAGRMKLEDLPENLKANVKEMQENNGQLLAVTPDVGGILDDLQRHEAKMKMVKEYNDRNNEPLAVTPSPIFSPSGPSM